MLDYIDLTLCILSALVVVPVVTGGNGKRPLASLILLAEAVLFWGTVEGLSQHDTLSQHIRREILALVLVGCVVWAIRAGGNEH